MENNKEIGKIIKDKLSNLDASPSDDLWGKIEKNLDNNKKKPIFTYFLWFLSGVLFSYLFLHYNNSTSKDIHTLKSGDSSEINKNIDSTRHLEQNDLKSSITKIKENDEYIIYESCQTYKVLKNSKNLYSESDFQNQTLKKEISKLSSDETSEKYNKNTIQQLKKTNNQNPLNQSTKKNDSTEGNATTFGHKKQLGDLFVNENQNIDTTKINNKQNIDTIAKKDIKKKSNKKEDKKEELKDKKNIKSKNIITVFYGPTFFNTITQGSSINQSLIETEKSTNIQSSFGAYYVKKFTRNGFRVGLAKTDLSYNSLLTKKNNSFALDFKNINLEEGIDLNTINSNYSNVNAIHLKQKTSYFQFPVEVFQTIYGFEKKFKINFLAGVTPEILIENSLYLKNTNNNNTTKLGSAENLRKFNLTSQLGLGFNYNVNEKYFVFCDPIFKYQVIPYTDYYEFTPYYFTIQIGLGYQF